MKPGCCAGDPAGRGSSDRARRPPRAEDDRRDRGKQIDGGGAGRAARRILREEEGRQPPRGTAMLNAMSEEHGHPEQAGNAETRMVAGDSPSVEVKKFASFLARAGRACESRKTPIRVTGRRRSSRTRQPRRRRAGRPAARCLRRRRRPAARRQQATRRRWNAGDALRPHSIRPLDGMDVCRSARWPARPPAVAPAARANTRSGQRLDGGRDLGLQVRGKGGVAEAPRATASRGGSEEAQEGLDHGLLGRIGVLGATIS